MRRVAGTAAVGATLLAGTAAIALAAPATITNTGEAFTGAPFNHDAGTVAQFHDTGGTHNVTATAKGPDGKALFRTLTVNGGTVPIEGTQYLPPGSYPFICTVHPTTMTGDLVVGAGTPLARPAVTLQVLDKKLKKVVKKAQLRVKVTSTGSGQMPVSAFLGKKEVVIGTELAAPGTKVVKLPFTSKGLTAIARKKKATLTVKSSISFGNPSTATAKLK